MRKHLCRLAAIGAVLALLACGCAAAGSGLSERYAKTFSLLGTELADPGAIRNLGQIEAEYNERSNQTARKLELANGGSLWVNEAGEIVEIDNFGGTGGADSQQAAADLLEREFALEGYVRTTRESSGLLFLAWEKQEGEYRNPYDSLRVVLNEETFGLELLTRYYFPAETTEPALTEAEALEAAAPYLGASQYDRVELVCQRTNLNAGTLDLPKYGTTARLVYVFYRDRLRVSIDAVTGEITGRDEVISAEGPNI